MSVKSLMNAAAEAMLRGDADAVEKANAALAELRSGQVGDDAHQMRRHCNSSNQKTTS